MATINKTVLEASHRLGFLSPRGELSEDQLIVLPKTIKLACCLLSAIHKAGDNGLNAEQIAKRLGIAENTVFAYCRELLKFGLIEVGGEVGTAPAGRLKNVYFRKDSE